MSAPARADRHFTERRLGRAALVTCFALILPGCPLSDGYYVDAMLGSGGASAGAPGPPTAGMPSDMGGREATGGREGMTGGKQATGGIAGNVACESTTEVCDGVDDDCDGDIDEGDVCPTECTARVFGAHTYLLCVPAMDDRLQHYESTLRCTGFTEQAGLAVPPDLELARVESGEENEFLKRWFRDAKLGSGLIWNGASDVRDETIWVWGRGVDVEVQFFTGNGRGGGMPYMGAYADFARGEPHGVAADGIDCGAFDSSVDWRWVDADCLLEPLGYVCESEE